MNVTKQHLAGVCGKVNPICHNDFYSGVHGRDALSGVRDLYIGG